MTQTMLRRGIALMAGLLSGALHADAERLADLLPGPTGSRPSLYTPVNGDTFFRATHGDSGTELWFTDGTAAGTRVLDIHPGSSSGNLLDIAEFNGAAVLGATDGVAGTELWRSDGTSAGTTLIKDIQPGSASSNPRGFTRLGGLVLFTADAGSGVELWRSDGTAAGTSVVSSINSPTLLYFTVLGERMYFAADDGVAGLELWRTDGTPAGTVLVKDINPGAASSITNNGGNFIGMQSTAAGDLLFLRADDGATGDELWISDGTAAGTVLLQDIRTGSADGRPDKFFAHGNQLLFVATTTSSGRELWTSDGTAAGTEMLLEIGSNSASGTADPPEFTASQDFVYFRGSDIRGTELWRTDGTAANTQLVTELVPGAGGLAPPKRLVDVDGTLYFGGTDRVAPTGIPDNYELWRSDGTAAGTVRVRDINPGDAPSDPISLTASNGLLLFTADDGTSGEEPWIVRPPASALASAVLPVSRSVAVGTSATVFATLLNTRATEATQCRIELLSQLPVSFSFQTTDAATNAPTGSPNMPVTIAANGGQSFVLALTPSAAFPPTDVRFRFRCAGESAAPVFGFAAINTLLLSAAAGSVPDVIAQGATASGDGILDLLGAEGNAAFAVGTFNVGSAASITASADTGSQALPVLLNMCQTDTASGACSSAIGPQVTTSINANSSASFAVFASGTGNVPFDPAHNRVIVRFSDDAGVVRGATSVALRTQ